MGSAARTAGVLLAMAVLALMVWSAIAGAINMVTRSDEKQCGHFARTHARIEAAQGGEADARAARELEKRCRVHGGELARHTGGGA